MNNRRIDGCCTMTHHSDQPDWLCRRMAVLPRPARFLTVGACGLLTDLAAFTALPFHMTQPLPARALSLIAATLVTWRLNRAITFSATGRRPHKEALRYAAVTATAQGVSFAMFSALVLTAMAQTPQVALLVGAAAGAAVAYAGHSLFSFRPQGQARPDRNMRGAP